MDFKKQNALKQKRWRKRQKKELKQLRKRKFQMQLKMYSIRDSKAEAFNPPFYKNTHGEAERDFTTLVRDEKSQVHQYPEDYDLYYVGSWDQITGKIEPLDTPQHIVKAVQVKERNLQ